MQQIQQQINLFHGLFVACLVFCLICLALSIFFFIKFDIINIFNVKTGRSVKKSVEEMKKVNERTGQFRPSGTLSGEKKNGKTRKATVQSPEELKREGKTPTDPLEKSDRGGHPETGYAGVLKENGPVEGASATTVLEQGASATTVLSGAADGTTVLSSAWTEEIRQPDVEPEEEIGTEYNMEIAQSEVDQQYGKFELLTSIMLIHTDEAV